MFYKLFVLAMFFLFSGNPSKENMRYYREYYQTGKPKAEGWVKAGAKTGYWKFYHDNGNVSEKGDYKNGQRHGYWYFYAPNRVRSKEGHYSNGEKVNWWLYYDTRGKIDYKCQLNVGKKDGYCLQYSNGDISSAIKYAQGKKIKEWHDLRSFKRENRLSDWR